MSYFTQSQPKVRQEGFAPSPTQQPPPSPPPSSFDNSNMFFAHHIFPNNNPQSDSAHRPSGMPNSLDFGDELAAMMAHQQERAPSPHHNHPPHNPFDTNSTAPYRQPPHNIFDISSPHHPQHQPQQHQSFPAHFSLPAASGFDRPFDVGLDGYRDAAAFPDRRASSRSRSRSKPPASVRPNKAKRASISTTSPRIANPASPRSPTRPQAILIPPNGVHPHHHHPASPLSLHMHSQTAPSAWFAAADSPFSLPTPDSIGVGHQFGSVPTTGASPKSVSAKESPPPSAQDAASKQAQLASEKRRRRRESHNAVERRRRDNINEKISELATLIPECMLDPGAGGVGGDASLDGFAGVPHEDGNEAERERDRKERDAAAGAVKANKGMILRKSVEYIRYLQQLVSAQATRNRELEAQLAQGGSAVSADSPGFNTGSPNGHFATDSSPNGHFNPGSPNGHFASAGSPVGFSQADFASPSQADDSPPGAPGVGVGVVVMDELMDQSDGEEEEEQGDEHEPRGRVTRGRPLGVRVKREEEGEEGKRMEE